jgi:type II secretory pathway component PulF
MKTRGPITLSLTLPHLTVLCHQLALLTNGAIPIVRCFELLAAGKHGYILKRLCGRIAERIRCGATLTQAVEGERFYLPHFFIALIHVGEQSGTLNRSFSLLKQYYDDMLALRRELMRQLFYPFCLVLAIFIGIPVLMAFWNGGEDWLWRAGRIILRGTITACALLCLLSLMLRQSQLRQFTFSALLYIPVVSRLIVHLGIARFAWAMELLQQVSIPPHHAVAMAARATELPPMERDLLQVAPRLQCHSSLSEAVSTSKYLTPTDNAYIDVGETSGDLEAAFRSMAKDHYGSAIHIQWSVVTLIGGLLIVGIGMNVLGRLL